jgi:hypothetical protein
VWSTKKVIGISVLLAHHNQLDFGQIIHSNRDRRFEIRMRILYKYLQNLIALTFFYIKKLYTEWKVSFFLLKNYTLKSLFQVISFGLFKSLRPDFTCYCIFESRWNLIRSDSILSHPNSFKQIIKFSLDYWIVNNLQQIFVIFTDFMYSSQSSQFNFELNAYTHFPSMILFPPNATPAPLALN